MPDIMGKMDIAFPHLNIYLENVPKSFTVFGFSIALYGVIIGLGFFLALILISKIAGATGQNPDTYWDVATFVIIFSILGARAYYVFFAWDYYKDNLISVFNIRNGGLAIYGGVIAGFLTAFIYCRIKKVNFFLLTDTIMPGLLLGQVMGRWGNFTNREAFGEYTDNLFAMRLPVEAVRSGEITELMKAHMVEGTNYIQVSPTFLYESMWNLCLLIIVLLYIKHKKFDGEIVLLYLGGYGLGRFWIEGLRTDQLIMHTTGLPVSQMLAMCLVVFSVTAMIIKRLKMREK
ncbi:prolipoprotein diacylglyceryl transferase [Butyrivibrio sp.]|uniref:prolipoprotein diacylglyceryl transferase n=1 Tax=Butyrivibrio sp. TaxID=28121 RepID=UPI0025C69A9D|nr:prolipoprotein diacylglyceryl transferase [Butyrivibrio sp.]MBQ9302928.1 prolipoprotein diacylglyceryl transferase [Butyrivibrio sp.]